MTSKATCSDFIRAIPFTVRPIDVQRSGANMGLHFTTSLVDLVRNRALANQVRAAQQAKSVPFTERTMRQTIARMVLEHGLHAVQAALDEVALKAAGDEQS